MKLNIFLLFLVIFAAITSASPIAKRSYPITESETPECEESKKPPDVERGYPIAESETPDGYPIAGRGYPIAESESPDGYPIAERGYPIAESESPDCDECKSPEG